MGVRQGCGVWVVAFLLGDRRGHCWLGVPVSPGAVRQGRAGRVAALLVEGDGHCMRVWVLLLVSSGGTIPLQGQQ